MVLDVNFGLEKVVSYFGGNNVSKLYADSYWFLRYLHQATEKINDVQGYEKFLKDIDRSLVPKDTLCLYEFILLREFRQSLDEVSEYLLKKALPNLQFRDSKDFFSDETTEQMQGYLKELHNGDRAKKFEVDERFLGILWGFYETARNLEAFYGQKKVEPILKDRQAMLLRHSLFNHMNEKFSRHYNNRI